MTSVSIKSRVRGATDLRQFLSLLRRHGFLLAVALIIGYAVTAGDGFATELDPTLARNLFLINSYLADQSGISTARLAQEGLPVSTDPLLRVFIYFDHIPNTSDYSYLALNSLTVFPNTYLPPIGSHRFGFLLAEGTATSIKTIIQSGRFPRICAAHRKLSPKNDLAAVETGVSVARTWEPPLTGRGVRVAILDSGFRFDHPDLPEAVESMDYSAYPDSNRDATDHISGHGTHVAGTAFGNGQLSGGQWKGMAPNADPIYFKIGDDSTGDATSVAVIGAIRAAATWADADILSMSYGGSDGFNDGSSPEEQAVDWAVGEGVSVFMSAGNSATDKEHFSAVVRANSTSDPIQIVTKFAPDSATWGIGVVWFDGADTSIHRDISVQIFDSNNEPVQTDLLPRSSSPRGTDYIEYLSREFIPADSTSYFARITNRSNFDQKVHLWTLSSHWFVRFNQADPAYTVLSPSTADSCISVGAFTSRNRWRDFEGVDHLDRTVIGDIASFSSIGPRIDGHQKPDICAPGRRLISCRDLANIRVGEGLDYAIISTDGDSGLPADYVAFMGTSMSSPAAAGAAALIMEGEPGLTPPQLRELFMRTARVDDQTGAVPNNVWGWGKIDVVSALSAEDEDKNEPNSPHLFNLLATYPTPSNGSVVLEYDIAEPAAISFKIFDPSGRNIWNTEVSKSQPGRKILSIPGEVIDVSGLYLVNIEVGNQRASARVMIVR